MSKTAKTATYLCALVRVIHILRSAVRRTCMVANPSDFLMWCIHATPTNRPPTVLNSMCARSIWSAQNTCGYVCGGLVRRIAMECIVNFEPKRSVCVCVCIRLAAISHRLRCDALCVNLKSPPDARSEIRLFPSSLYSLCWFCGVRLCTQCC